MTEDEKRQQRAMLLLEYHEAEQHLAHLREKAKLISHRLNAVSKWMEEWSHKGANAIHGEVYLVALGGKVDVLNDPEIAAAMDFASIRGLAIEIQEADRRVREFSDRKQSLGLK
jgi:hypothetical protein